MRSAHLLGACVTVTHSALQPTGSMVVTILVSLITRPRYPPLTQASGYYRPRLLRPMRRGLAGLPPANADARFHTARSFLSSPLPLLSLLLPRVACKVRTKVCGASYLADFMCRFNRFMCRIRFNENQPCIVGFKMRCLEIR